MTLSVEIQQENQLRERISQFLIYFKEVRGIGNRLLAEKIPYGENYLSNVRNGDKDGSEKLLHALESFYLLDNLQQIAQIDRQIMELEREKLVLQGQSVEKFYVERAKPLAHQRTLNPALNERAGEPVPVSSPPAPPTAAQQKLLAVVKKHAKEKRHPGTKPKP